MRDRAHPSGGERARSQGQTLEDEIEESARGLQVGVEEDAAEEGAEEPIDDGSGEAERAQPLQDGGFIRVRQEVVVGLCREPEADQAH